MEKAARVKLNFLVKNECFKGGSPGGRGVFRSKNTTYTTTVVRFAKFRHDKPQSCCVPK